MRRSVALLLPSALSLLLVGCPEGDPAVDLTRDVGSVDGADGADDTDATDAADAVDGTDAADSADATDGNDGTSDVVTPSDTTEPTDTSTPPDTASGECQVDDDCLAVVGPLGPCQVPLCEDNTCFVDSKPPSPCDDGDVCTSGDACSKGQCAGVALDCDDGNPCTDDACDPFLGSCTNTPVPADQPVVCDDGNPCTTTDHCKEGVCTAAPEACPGCTVDGDCAALDDGNACNGVVACLAGVCGLKPGSAISCDGVAAGVCQVAVCDPATGGCVPGPAPDGTACDAGSKCSAPGACSAGACAAAPLVCDDGNPCTQDACDPAAGCVGQPLDGIACDDGNGCSTGDTCTKGVCAGTSGVNCDDGKPCTKDTCDPVTKVCANTPYAGTCTDGNACTTDTCDAATGTCVSGTASCDDGSACTVDDCSPASGCLNAAITCDDGNSCTTDTCDPVKGCVTSGPVGACSADGDCNDGDPCTLDTCSGTCGTCEHKPFPCFDGDACTTDSCVAGVGCSFAPATGVPCDDGDECTGNDQCLGGQCVAGTVVCEVGTELNPSPNCQTILQFYPGKPSGLYWLRPNATIAPFQAYCDMTTAGGGFTRVANIGGERPICSLADGIGTAADVAAGGATTAILPIDVAGAIPFLYRQILVVFSTGGYYVLSSGNSGFNWTSVANGTVNSSNVANYGVEGAKNGGAAETLKSNAVVAPFKGGALLGGSLTSGTSPYLGVGAQRTGTFKNDAACAALTGVNGVYKSALFGGLTWGGKVTVLIR